MLLPIISAGTSKYKPLIDYKWYTSPIADDYVLDKEELENGSFDTDMVWVKGTGWSISGGVANCDGTQTEYSGIEQTVLKLGSTYLIETEILSTTGNISVGSSGSFLVVSTAGVYYHAFTPTLDTQAGVVTAAGVSCSIGSISVRRVLQEPDIRYLADSGSSPKYPARSYFGRGAKFNGIDQEVVIPVTFTDQQVSFVFNFVMDSALFSNYLIRFSSNPTIWIHGGALRVYISGTNYDTILVNGNHSVVLVIDNGTLKVFSNTILMNTFDVGNIALYDITTTIGSGGGTAYHSGTLSNIQFHNRALTPTQISYQYSYPEKFLYREEGLGEDIFSDLLTSSSPTMVINQIVNGYNIVADGTSSDLNFDLVISEDAIGYVQLSFYAKVNSGAMTITGYYDGSATVPLIHTVVDGLNTITVQDRASNLVVKIYTSIAEAYDVDMTSIDTKEIKPILKSHILTQSEIDNVVAYLPMCETDGYVRDLVGYSETEQVLDGSFDSIKVIRDFGGSITILDNGRGKATNTVDADIRVGAISDNLLDIPIIIGDIVKYSFLIETDADTAIQIYNGAAYIDVATVLTGIQNQIDIVIESAGDYTGTIIKATSASNMWIDNLSVKKLSGTHPVTNFTNAVRDDAINLDKGLQSCFWKRDTLGVPYAGSFDRLECDGVGYSDTGWRILATEDFTIELVQEFVDNGEFNINGTRDSLTSRIYLGEANNGYATFRIAGVAQSIITTEIINHLVLEYNSTTREMIASLNGVSEAALDVSTFTDMISNFYLAKEVNSAYEVEKPIRLFKVHTTPQDPQALYNDALTKGLLV